MLDRTFNVTKKLGHVVSIGEAEGQPFKTIRERICRARRRLRVCTSAMSTMPCPNGRRASIMCWAALPPAG